MNILLSFAISFIVTTGFYYMWYRNRQNDKRNDYLHKILYFSLSVAVMIGAMYYLLNEPDILVVLFAYIGISIITDNVLVPAYFQKTLQTRRIDLFIPGVLNTTIIFVLLYLFLF